MLAQLLLTNPTFKNQIGSFLGVTEIEIEIELNFTEQHMHRY